MLQLFINYFYCSDLETPVVHVVEVSIEVGPLVSHESSHIVDVVVVVPETHVGSHIVEVTTVAEHFVIHSHEGSHVVDVVVDMITLVASPPGVPHVVVVVPDHLRAHAAEGITSFPSRAPSKALSDEKAQKKNHHRQLHAFKYLL